MTMLFYQADCPRGEVTPRFVIDPWLTCDPINTVIRRHLGTWAFVADLTERNAYFGAQNAELLGLSLPWPESS